MSQQLTVLLDGWSLVNQPNSPAALHLLAMRACHPKQAAAALALPADPPEWLTGDFQPIVRHTPDTARGRLLWEQRILPELARAVRADLVHLCGMHPALFSSTPSLVSPAEYSEPTHEMGFYARLRVALAAGGASRSGALLWPIDVPDAPAGVQALRAAPVAFPEAWDSDPNVPAEIERLGLPETFVLYHGPGAGAELRRLLEAFSWAADPLGVDYPLLILGLDAPSRSRLAALLQEYRLEDRVWALPVVRPGTIQAIYRRSAVVFHPAESPAWGSPLRLALACARPLVAGETALTDAMVGPAAYLAALHQPRALGAALITLVVETELAARLSAAAGQRASHWRSQAFQRGLWEAYQAVCTGSEG